MSNKSKKVVDARSDSKGRTISVRFEGNLTDTPIETAKRMVKKGQVAGIHIVKTSKNTSYLRTNPDKNKGNNLDHLCGDK